MSNTINKLIRQVSKELGSTTMTISHDLNSIRTIADKVALLDNGNIAWAGTIGAFKKSENQSIKEFISPNLA